MSSRRASCALRMDTNESAAVRRRDHRRLYRRDQLVDDLARRGGAIRQPAPDRHPHGVQVHFREHRGLRGGLAVGRHVVSGSGEQSAQIGHDPHPRPHQTIPSTSSAAQCAQRRTGTEAIARLPGQSTPQIRECHPGVLGASVPARPCGEALCLPEGIDADSAVHRSLWPFCGAPLPDPRPGQPGTGAPDHQGKCGPMLPGARSGCHRTGDQHAGQPRLGDLPSPGPQIRSPEPVTDRLQLILDTPWTFLRYSACAAVLPDPELPRIGASQRRCRGGSQRGQRASARRNDVEARKARRTIGWPGETVSCRGRLQALRLIADRRRTKTSRRCRRATASPESRRTLLDGQTRQPLN